MKRRRSKTSSAFRSGTGRRIYDFITLVEQLPYGASKMQEKRVARVTLGTGLLVMAFGASFFAVGWGFKVTWLVETAFFATLVGWMMVIIGFAFWVVSSFSKKFITKHLKD